MLYERETQKIVYQARSLSGSRASFRTASGSRSSPPPYGRTAGAMSSGGISRTARAISVKLPQCKIFSSFRIGRFGRPFGLRRKVYHGREGRFCQCGPGNRDLFSGEGEKSLHAYGIWAGFVRTGGRASGNRSRTHTRGCFAISANGRGYFFGVAARFL